jgi:diguanylate cyclase (GGDEF)-like protein/PAS domain S-box-containing protein
MSDMIDLFDRAPAIAERFRFAFDNAAIAMALVGLDGSYIRVNPAFCKMMGRTEQELQDRSLNDITHTDDVAADTAGMQDLLKGVRDTYETDKRYVLPDGSTIWGHLTATLITENDVPICFFGQVVDITTAKNTERALKESESRIRLLAANARDFLIFRLALAPTFQVEEMSAAIEEITGHTPEEFFADPTLLLRVVDPGDRDKLRDAIRFPTSDAEPVLLRWNHKDGRTTWSMGRAMPIFGEDGTVIGLQGIAYDVTAQREAEDARDAEARRFRSLVQNATDLVAIIAAGGTTSYVTPSVKRMLGFQPEEFKGMTAHDLVHPEDIEGASNALAASLNSAGSHSPAQFRLLHRNGTYRWVEASFASALDDPAIQGVIVNARDITERKAIEEQLVHQALHDRLTDLPNRPLLADRLQRALGRLARRQGAVAVVSLNVDRFRFVNENLGHDAGDELLIDVAGRLAGGLRSTDTLARVGGDEFVISIEVSGEHEALVLANSLLDRFAEPLHVRGREVHLSVSIGVALTQDATESPEHLLRAAELAMRRAKAAGGGRVEAFDESMRARAVGRLEMESALRRAIDQKELRVFYQPVVSLADRSIVGGEALVRWERPDVGLVSPADFIPLAEETGLIVPIGEWIFEQACIQVEEWNRGSKRPLSVAVNLSVRQFADPVLLQRLKRVISRSAVDPSCISLEITESMLIEDNDFVLEALVALKALGIRLALDDFGTQYSSLSYLRRFPFDILKVDQSFVRDMLNEARDREIVRSVISLAHAIGLTVVAEGIETEEQFEAVREMGADRAQGYLLARPLPAAAFSELLRPASAMQLSRSPGAASTRLRR